MPIEYLGLSSINGPLIVLEGVQDAFYDEIVEFIVGGKEKRIGRIIELYEDKAVIQVFEGSEKACPLTTPTPASPAIPWRSPCPRTCWDEPSTASGSPLTIWGPLPQDSERDVNGLPLNPVKREYPRNYIRTGISAIDGLTTSDPGTEAAYFSPATDCPHDQLAAQIVKQASSGGGLGRRICHRLCRHGRQARCGGFLPQDL